MFLLKDKLSKMESWWKISLVLCAFGILKEFRPSEPFVTKYLKGPPVNFTDQVIQDDIYPVGTYANMALLVLIFLITDFSRYKPIIILQGVAGVITYVLIICSRALWLFQILEVFYGLFMACDVAYYTYIYAKVDAQHYQKVTGHTRAAYLIGRAISGIVSQALISSNLFSYYELNFFTLGGMILATVWSLLLPPVNRSMYFHQAIDPSDSTQNTVVAGNKLVRGLKYIWKDFKDAYTNPYVIKWAFWWALATCGYYQVLSYVQLLWEQVIHETGETEHGNWNGLIEALYTIFSACASFLCGMVYFNWERFGELAMGICSLLIGAILFIMSQSANIWVAYLTYIVYTVIYHAMITISNSEVAKSVNPDSHGLVFGFTGFIALILQSILTAIVISALSLSPRVQFLVYGTYFVILGAIFVLMTAYSWIRRGYLRGRNMIEISE